MRVEPIRDKTVIKRITEALEDDQTEAGKRRFLLWETGLFLGRRISDMLKMSVGDVYGKEKLVIKEGKTDKQIELFFPKTLKRVYKERLAGRALDEPLFVSRQHDRINGKVKPIDRKTAYRDIQEIKKIGCFPEGYNIGTHTLRKTFGYHYYQKTKDIASLMKLFNHSKEEITQIYIGLSSDEMKQSFGKVDSMYDT